MAVEHQIEACKRKKCHWTKEKALKAAKSQMISNPSGPDLDVYHCEWCNGWHLTKTNKPR